MSESAVRRRPAAVLFVACLLGGGSLAWRPVGGPSQEFREISPEAADSLGLKIRRVQEAEADSSRRSAARTIRVSEVEMESFVLYWMKDEIPPRVESIDVTVGEGVISAEVALTFDAENRTGNVVVDTLFQGTHILRVRGALAGESGRGEFELREVRLDGYSVPLIVIEVLVSRFVTPRYPQVDLNEPFTIPWGIETIRLVPGRAEIAY